MRPIKLKIAGLNSFMKEEEIDFTLLTGKGFFGIFGPTGSGKSSILDAITIALYGRISRDTREFINKYTGRLYVGFEFAQGTDNEYKVERRMKISSAGGYKTTLARLVVKEGDRQEVYDKVNAIDARIAEIIGLNYEDFIRTVVLPQGKFSRFLKLTGRDRSDMLERILGLEEFGQELIDKLQKHKNICFARIKAIEAVLNKYIEVSEEKLEESKKELIEQEIELKDTADKLRVKREEFDRYKQVGKLQQELDSFEKALADLEENKDNIEISKKKITRIEQIVSIKSELNRFTENSQKLDESRQELKELREEIDEMANNREILSRTYNQTAGQREKDLLALVSKKLEVQHALELSKKNKALTVSIEKLEEKLKGLGVKRAELVTKIFGVEEELKSQNWRVESDEEKIEELEIEAEYREKITAGQELEWDFEHARERLENLELKWRKRSGEIEEQKEKFENLKKDLMTVEAEIFLAVCQESEERRDKKEALEEEIVLLEKNENRLLAELNFIETQFEQRRVSLDNLQLELEQLKKETNIKSGGLAEASKNLEEITAELKGQQKKTEEKSTILRETLDDLKMNSFATEAERIKEKDRAVEKLRRQLKNERKKLKENRNLLQRIKEEYEEIEKELALGNREREIKLETRAENWKQIRDKLGKKDPGTDSGRAFMAKTTADIDRIQRPTERLAKILKSREIDPVQDPAQVQVPVPVQDLDTYLELIEELEQEFKEKAEKNRAEFEKAEKLFWQRENRRSVAEDRVERLQKDQEELKRLLEEKLQEFEIDSFERAREYLELEKDIAGLIAAVKNYEIRELEIKNNIIRLKEELAGKSIAVEEWEALADKKAALEKKQEELQEKIGGQKRSIEQLRRDLADKKGNLAEKKEVEREMALIKEISHLVRGKRFLEFVAGRQLRYITWEASRRLMEITGNRYQLELSKEGEFVIGDLHNGGVMRSCSTLSGGETFLASLSLALALSSQIQLKGQAKIEIFFLDEGFGALDYNLLDIVMNSLEKLRDEELVVGIISHKEELKSRVPVKLLIEPARPGINGTKVKMSYS